MPAEVEKKFAGRIVYATVFPLPARSAVGDWTLWFAERAMQRYGTRPLMRPPTLVFAEGMPIPVIPHGMFTRGKLELAGILKHEGRLDALAPVASVDPALTDPIIAALLNWRFTPAICRGAPLDVDVVIVIPAAER